METIIKTRIIGLTPSVAPPAGRRKYRDYLGWISETDEEARRLGFEGMTKGWAKGTADFK